MIIGAYFLTIIYQIRKLLTKEKNGNWKSRSFRKDKKKRYITNQQKVERNKRIIYNIKMLISDTLYHILYKK